MRKSQKSFREQLLDAEQFNPFYRSKYEREVRTMLEEKLTPMKRWAFVGWTILGLGFFIIFGITAIVGKELPVLGRILFAMGSVFGLAYAALMVRIAVKGTFDQNVHSKTITGLTWIFVVIMVTLFMLQTGKNPDSTRSVYIMVTQLVFFIMGATFLIIYHIYRVDMRTREKLLEIEYRLASVTDGFAGEKSDRNHSDFLQSSDGRNRSIEGKFSDKEKQFLHELLQWDQTGKSIQTIICYFFLIMGGIVFVVAALLTAQHLNDRVSLLVMVPGAFMAIVFFLLFVVGQWWITERQCIVSIVKKLYSET